MQTNKLTDHHTCDFEVISTDMAVRKGVNRHYGKYNIKITKNFTGYLNASISIFMNSNILIYLPYMFPPIMKQAFNFFPILGSNISATARLVRGPVATRVTSPEQF